MTTFSMHLSRTRMFTEARRTSRWRPSANRASAAVVDHTSTRFDLEHFAALILRIDTAQRPQPRDRSPQRPMFQSSNKLRHPPRGH